MALKVKSLPVEGEISLGALHMITNHTLKFDIGSSFRLDSITDENIAILVNGPYNKKEIPIDNICRAKYFLLTTDYKIGDEIWKLRNNNDIPKKYTCANIDGVGFYKNIYDKDGVKIGTNDEFGKIVGEISSEAKVSDFDIVSESDIKPFIIYKGNQYGINMLDYFKNVIEFRNAYKIVYRVKCSKCEHFH